MKKLSLVLLLGVAVTVGMFAASVETSVTDQSVVQEAEAMYTSPFSNGKGGCDGKGMKAECSACSGSSCSAVCIGAQTCTVYFPTGGGDKQCTTKGNAKCVSGSVTISPGSYIY